MEAEITTSYTHQEEDEQNDNNINEERVLNQILLPSTDEHAIAAEKISSPATENLKDEDPEIASDDLSDDDQSEEDEEEEEEEEEEEVEVEVEPENQQRQQQQHQQQKSPKPTIAYDDEDEDEDDDTNRNPRKKQKSLSSFNTIENPETAPPVQIPTTTAAEPTAATAGETVTVAEASAATAAAVAVSTATAVVKKPKKKNNNVWTKSTRKGKKKTKSNNHNGTATEDPVLITPIPRFPDRSDDSADAKICLSKVYKAEKVELSEDRLSAGSSKGYRMVRATRGVAEGAWYFEIRVLKLGETGHTRLGWSMEKGDLQAPVGYDGNSFGYRDVDGSKVNKAVREKYGEEGYVEGDVIGCYINLPDGGGYAPKPPHFVWYKGQRYMCTDGKEESPKVVPGSEISFFKNGVCQGVAFKDLFGGCYYPAASMYTLPNQPNCVVTFNFGPEFEFFPQDFDGRPMPRPMIEVPYHGFDSRVENGESIEKKH